MKINIIIIITVLLLAILYLSTRIQTSTKQAINIERASTIIPVALATPTTTRSVESQTKTQNEKLPTLSGAAIFGVINSYRASNNKPYWSVSDELCRLAEQRAEYLIQPNYEDFMKNTYPSFKNHPGFQDMANAFNYSGLGLSENLAMGAKSDAGVVNMWKNSPAHNGLMLASDHNGATYTKACVATRVKYYGSITVLLVGDK